ncbi:Glu/Leu/Phe/Val dehydrogenase [Halobacteria archaeon AArc-m2/3/4]|uniref:Glutamate dehydrogenase n=1 Tax=Natronoglomus mannanivorans TaxID=2979990 RepID=A0ABT2QHW4_9EURY|nr:Glu/Leu/Phe/Val dehydrogenase [Halobacteria archaeon AArc-m2/3/4]
MTTPPATPIEQSLDQHLDAPRTFLAAAACSLSDDHDLERRLATPRHSQRVAIELEREDGSDGIVDGFRVRHDDARGPFLGPLRCQPGLDTKDCAGLATAQTVTAAIADVPFGGAAGGLAVDPSTLSRDERDRLVRQFAERIDGLGPDDDVFTPGAGTDGRTMAQFVDRVADRVDGPHRATVTGKPPAIGGLEGISHAAGHSTALVTQDVFEEDHGRSLANATVTVAGCGPGATTAARLLERQGATVVAWCSSHGGLASADGLDVAAAVDSVRQPGELTTADGTMTGTENVLERDVDVLVLASPDVPLTARRAKTVGASLIVEGTHAVVTPDGQRQLDDRPVTVVPDVLATAGSVVAAHLEWVQSTGRDRWGEARLRNELGYALLEAVDDVRERRDRDELSWREAAYGLALARLDDAHEVIR